MMAPTKHESAPEVFDRFFGRFPDWLPRPWMIWPDESDGLLRVNEYRENGNMVVRAEIGGIDPEKDVEITVANGTLHIEARREVEQKTAGKDYIRRELRYGSFLRDLPLPEGCSEQDISASYKDGILEVRFPAPSAQGQSGTRKVPVKKA